MVAISPTQTSADRDHAIITSGMLAAWTHLGLLRHPPAYLPWTSSQWLLDRHSAVDHFDLNYCKVSKNYPQMTSGVLGLWWVCLFAWLHVMHDRGKI